MLPIISLEEFESCPWKEALNGVSQDIHNYSSALNGKAKEYDKDSSHFKALNFLSALCDMMLNTDDNGPVFKPMLVFESKRSPLPEDIPDENFETLFVFASSITEPILRARLMDILWVRKTPNKVDAAREAVASYIECATFPQIAIYECVIYLKRALNITYELGKAGNEIREKVVNAFEQVVQNLNPQELNGLHHQLFSTMVEKEISDQNKLYNLMIDAAGSHEEKSNFLLMRGFLELARKFAKNAKLTDDVIKAIQVREAESYVQEACSRDNAMVQSHFYEQAIQAYRCVGGYESKIEDLHKQMLAIQKKIPEFLGAFSTPLPDMSDIIERAIKAVSGKETFDALLIFALITNPVDPKKERADAIEQSKRFVLSNLFARRMMDKNGKIVSISDGLGTKEITGDEPAIFSNMMQSFHLNIHLSLYARILPALRTILEEHEITALLLSDIVKNNQLVPPGREMFFLRGLKSGFEYDFVTASLYLIPQLENSIREMMAHDGVITSKLTSTGIQREKDLNDLFEEDYVKKTFGYEYIYTLKALLTEQEGANLRNRLAHGLAEYNQLQGDAAVYFWWLTLRLLLTPFMQQESSEQKNEET